MNPYDFEGSLPSRQKVGLSYMIVILCSHIFKSIFYVISVPTAGLILMTLRSVVTCSIDMSQPGAPPPPWSYLK